MVQPTRRVVTGHDVNGKAVILIDGAAPRGRAEAGIFERLGAED